MLNALKPYMSQCLTLIEGVLHKYIIFFQYQNSWIGQMFSFIIFFLFVLPFASYLFEVGEAQLDKDCAMFPFLKCESLSDDCWEFGEHYCICKKKKSM